MNGRKSQHIDVALEVLCQLAQPGQTMTAQDMADVCGCSKQYIYSVEKRAIDKLKLKLAGYRVNDFIDVPAHRNLNERVLTSTGARS